MKKRILSILVSVFALLLLTGCGGGGGSSSSNDTTITKTAYLKDNSIQGVTYTSGSQSGTTDANGAFEYEENSSVTFSIGGVTLGVINSSNIQSDNIVYPSDILGIARGNIEQNLENPTLVRILRFLQSLDSDNDPSNGITIDSATITALNGVTLDLSLETTTDEEMENIITSLGKTLVSKTQSIEHFRTTLLADSVVNTPPTPTFESFSVYQNSSFNGTLTANDLNTNDTLTYTKVVEPLNGTLTINTDGTFIYTPTIEYIGEDSFSYKVNDGISESETQRVTITILSTNTTPTVNSVTINTNEDTPYTFTTSNFANGFVDNDGDTLIKIKLSSLPLNGTLTLNGENLSVDSEIESANLSNLLYTPNENYNGEDSFSGYGYDGESYSNEATMNIIITSVDDSVTIEGTPVTTAYSGESYSFQCSANNPDNNSLVYSISNKPRFVIFDTTSCTLSGELEQRDQGVYNNIIITVSDGKSSDSLSFDLIVEEPITYSWDISDWSSCSGSCGVDNGTQTRSVICQSSKGNSVNDSYCTGTKPDTSRSCTASLCNQAPSITSNNTTNTAENQTTVLTVTATDLENDTVTFSLTGGADQALFSIDANSGALTFQNAPDFETPLDANTDNEYIVEVTATDDGTGNLTDTQTITVTITNIGDHYILNAIYDDKRTSAVTDDILYLYMNEEIAPATFNADSSLNYDITGTGVIGSSSTNTYTDTLFHRHKIELNDTGTPSTAFVEDIDTINIKANQIEDANGSTTTLNTTATVKKFNPLARLKTGQTTSYPNGDNTDRDDGYYQATVGIARSYTDNGNGTVTDNATGLIWQQEDDNTQRNWADAGTYCDTLDLGGSTQWRLPTVEELISITDKSTFNPSINPVFTNTDSSSYWSSTTNASATSYGWGVNFYYGNDYWFDKTNTYYVRCVRASDN